MNGIRCALTVPALWEAGDGGLDRAPLALSRLLGLEALQAERPSRAEGHDLTPDVRMQAQLDLVLDALREIQSQLRPLPPAFSVSLTPERLQVSGLADTASGAGWVALWLDGRMPQPVWLPVIAEGQGGFRLSPPDEALSAAIDQLVFRLHRRAVARSRREQGADSVSLSPNVHTFPHPDLP
jgi:hypothetical protein